VEEGGRKGGRIGAKVGVGGRMERGAGRIRGWLEAEGGKEKGFRMNDVGTERSGGR